MGGITTFLYVDVDIADDIHPTYDVDFVLETSKRKDYDLFQEKLRKKGFTHDTSPGDSDALSFLSFNIAQALFKLLT